jgi:rRNA maturation endonuclease Nob1
VTRLDAGQHGPLQTGALLRLGEVQVAVRAPVTLRVRCPGPCGRVVEVPASGFCPYCGTALATADTFTG